MRKYLTFLCALSLLVGLGNALAYSHEFKRAQSLEDAHAASCRVSVSNARGTGSFIGVDKEKNLAIVLTNYHVVTNNKQATLDFWTNSERQSISGEVIAKAYDANMPVDCALIGVDIDALAKIDPPYLALAGKDAAPDANSYILSSGCPKGRFAQAWKGKTLGYYNGATVMFQPGPVPGQSGSAIVSEIDGELWVTGILTWLIGTEGSDDSKGGAIPIANVYKALNGRQSSLETIQQSLSPIPPDAVECADRSERYVIEITRDNCPACIRAKEDFKKIESAGFEISERNVSRDSVWLDFAKKYNITAVPAFLVFDPTGVLCERYIGAGKASEIIAKAQEYQVDEELDLTIEEEPEASTVDETTNEEPPAENDIIEPSCIVEDFRNRAPVYDIGNVGFFDDSDSRWNNRNSKKEPPKAAPKTESPTPPAKKDSPTIREKIFGGNSLKDELSGTIDGAIDKIERRLDEKVDGKIKELEGKASEFYIRWRIRVIFMLFVVFCLAVWFADAIKKAFCFCIEVVKSIVLFEDEEGKGNEVQSD